MGFFSSKASHRGKVTDFAGKELPVGMPGAVLAGNGKINEELLRILSEK